MATIVTRSGKGSPLTNTEVDSNFTNLNTDKIETDAQVRAAVEAASDSNVFTDADHTKLDDIETDATADQTAAEILAKVAYLPATDDRDMKPSTSGIGSTIKGIKSFFSSLGGMTGSADTDYQDVIVLDTYSDTSGGKANALVLDKSTHLIKHYQAVQTATTWGTPKTLAYTDQYSVGDGELTEINFTSADHTKLNDIEAGATTDQTADQLLASIKTVDVNGTAGVNAGTLGGQLPSSVAGNNTIVQRDAAGWIKGNYYNGTGTFATGGNASGMGIFTGTNGNDNFGRSYTAAAARTLLNVEDGATADQTADQLLTSIKTVDGAGSGLDADLLDGLSSSQFAKNYTFNIGSSGGSRRYVKLWTMTDTDDGVSGFLSMSGDYGDVDKATYQLTVGTRSGAISMDVFETSVDSVSDNFDFFYKDIGSSYEIWMLAADYNYNGQTAFVPISQFGGVTYNFDSITTTAPSSIVSVTKNKIWHSGNDGASSGLDADLLDGQHGSYYTGYTDTAVANLVDSSPAALNTLNELAAALGDDANFSSTVTGSIGTKLPLAGGAMTGPITTNSTFDGVDIAARNDVLTTTTTTANAALPKAGGTMTGNLKFNNNNSVYYEHNSNGGFIPFPGNAQYITNSNAHTGAIKIRLPVHGTNDMISFHVDVYDYSTNESFSLFIAGYIYQTTGNQQWTNVTVRNSTTNTAKDFTVRFGADGTKHCVWIGETNSTWSYPQVTVRDVQVGFTSDIDAWADDWAISFVTTFDTLTYTVSNNLPYAKVLNDSITGTQIADNAINSEHYVDGSIDNEHIADNAINSEHYADNSIDALHLNVSGNGTTSQFLRSDGDGTFTWATPTDTNTDTNTTYSAGTGLTLNGTTFSATADPTLTLAGDATGSATFTNLGNATLTVAVASDSHSHSQVYIPDTRGAVRAPSYYPDRYVSYDFQNQADTGAGDDTWHVLQTVAKWSSFNSGHTQQQIAYTGPNLKHREATSDTAWGDWKKVWDSGNDGTGSGLDADLLDGQHGSYYAVAHTHPYLPTTTPAKLSNLNTISNKSEIIPWNNVTTGRPASSQSNEYGTGIQLGYDGSYASQIAHDFDQDNLYYRKLSLSSDSGTWSKVWSSTNDGSGSGLDADLLDGQQGSYYYSSGNPPPLTADPTLTLTGDVTGSATFTNLGNATLTAVVANNSHQHTQLYANSTITYGASQLQWTDLSGAGGTGANGSTPKNPTSDWYHHIITNHANNGGYYYDLSLPFHQDELFFRRVSNGTQGAFRKVWHDGNDGSGSGLDADLLDGLHASSFLRSDGNDETTGALTISGSATSGGVSTVSQYHTGADNLILKGNSSGISSIFFQSEKDGTNINHTSDFGFLQFHSYGTNTVGEANELILGVSNDSDDCVIVNAPSATGFKFRTGASATDYTVFHEGNSTAFTSADNAKLVGIEAGAKADQVGLVKGADIGGSADLNTYTTDGYFHQNGNTNATSGTNYPVALAGMLSVQADGGMVYQKYQTYNGDGTWQRTKYGTTWFAWDKILDTGNSEAFTSADQLKLNGIATGATNTVTNATHTGEVTGSGALTVADNVIDAGNLKVTGNGTATQFLRSDGDGTFTWATPTDTNTDTNTTYTANSGFGMNLNGTDFRLENDRRRNASTVDIKSGNTHDYTFYDADVGIRWYTAAAEEMRLTDAGDLHVDGNVTAYSATVSDERLKHDIKPIENALDKVNAIGGYTFTYNKDDRKSAGVVAQEIQKVLPSAVSSSELPFHGEEGEEYLTVQYDQIIGLLIESVKELTAKVEALENAPTS